MKQTRRNFVAGGLTLGAGLVLSQGARFGARAAGSTFETAKQTKKLVIGIANEKPYGFVGADGKPTGAIVEVIRAALEPYGITDLEANVVDFGTMIPGINAGRFDIIGAGMYIRAARCAAVAFSNPVTRSGGAFITKKGNPKNVHSLKDVAANKDVKLGTQTGSAQVEELKQVGVPADQITLFAKDSEALAGLQADRVDVIYFPDLESNSLLDTAKDPDLERVSPFHQILDANGEESWNYQGLGFRKSDTDLIEAVNTQIAAMLASGKLLEVMKPFGYSENELPPADMTAAKACTLA